MHTSGIDNSVARGYVYSHRVAVRDIGQQHARELDDSLSAAVMAAGEGGRNDKDGQRDFDLHAWPAGGPGLFVSEGWCGRVNEGGQHDMEVTS